MSPFKLSSVKKKLGKIDREREDSSYSLQPFLLKWIKEHPPTLSYEMKASTMPFDTWKQQIKTLLQEKIKVLDPLPLNEQNLEMHGEANANGIHFIKLSLMALPGLRVPAILCFPNEMSSKMPAFICIHGHNQSKENSVGLKKSRSREYFGYELAKLGMVTLSLDWIGMGERERLFNKISIFLQNEGQRSNWVRFLGLSMLGLRITEIKALLSYLESRSEVDPKRFGIIGHSEGGRLSLFTTLLDNRIKVSGISGYFGTWEHSILAMFHCGCQYIADLRKFVELYDLYASLAPKPLAITIGRKDPIYPIEGTEIAIPIIKKAYLETGHSENLLIDIQPNGHKFYRDNIYPFLLKHI